MKTYNIAYFVRPWSVDYFKHISEVSVMRDISNPYFISDWNIENTHKINTNPLSKYQENSYIYSDKEYEKIINSCRMLRNIEIEKAKILINIVHTQVNNYIIKNIINIFIGIVIDNYIVDIIERICKGKAIKFIGLHMTFIDGYTLITSRGEYVKIREPDDDEIDRAIKKLNERYQPNYINYHKTSIYYGAYIILKNNIKVLYYKYKLFCNKEKYFYHYLSTYLVLKNKLKLYNTNKYINELNGINNISAKPIIYLPLQLTPECNSDYWGNNEDYIKDYEVDILKLCGSLNNDFILVLKEHPNMIGMRIESFYKKIHLMENTYLLKPNIKAKDIYPNIDLTLAFNSSAGIESILYKRKCILLNKVYYFSEDIHLYLSKEDIMKNDYKEKIYKYISKKINYDKCIRVLISKILSCCISASFNEIYFNKDINDNSNNMQLLTNGLIKHIEFS